jgi:L-ascorbate metabolism protein UlaG (beta-lactamase superfamily)
LGDLGHVLTSKQVEDLDNIDILMVPVGGVSTVAASQAAQVVRLLEPKIVIPMHYKTPALKRELESADAFLKEMAVKDLSPQNKLTVTRGTLHVVMQVTVLNYGLA